MAPKISSMTLRQTILWLEAENLQQQTDLKEQFHDTYQSLKPINLIKETLKDVARSPAQLQDILVPLLGLSTGYLTKRLVVGKSEDPDRMLIAEVLGKSVTSVIAQHPTEIIAAGKFILRFLFGPPKRKAQDED
jgi:hypothetical protein